VSSSSTAHARLERLKLALAAKRQPAADDVAWALSIDPESIGRHSDAGLEEAKRLIVEFSRRFPLMTSTVMCDRIERYETTAWPRDRLADECPPHRVGRVEEFCWKILRAYRAPSDRTIRRILEMEAVAKSRGAMASDHR
jgi:hypothetical protein